MNDNKPRSIKVVAFAGSLRKASYNKAILRASKELAPAELSIEIFDLADIPLYNADIDTEDKPSAVVDFKHAIQSSDGILIATPEYNHGVSGVTKNAIDWASRPPGNTVLNKKPIGIMGASPGMTGTARGQSQLRQALDATNAYCLPYPEVLISRAHQKINEKGILTDEPTREFLAKYLSVFYDWICILKG